MKCPIGITNEFSEWSNVCQDCQHYAECMNNTYNLENQNSNLSNNTNPFGDNYPNLFNHNHILDLAQNRQKMIQKLAQEGEIKIQPDDIINTQIDIEIHNKQCRKEKIKERNKRKKEKNDSI